MLVKMNSAQTQADCPTGPNVPDWMSPNRTFLNKHFRRFCLGLMRIPSDIPLDATHIKFYGNPIQVVHANAFVNLTKIHYMYIAWNYGLHTLELGAFNGLSGLKVLGMHDDNFTTLPAGIFEDLQNLTSLNLMYNKIERLPVGVFDGLESIQEIFLHDNNLTKLQSDLFRNLTTLELLNLARNQVSSVM